jgi:hypothetical protein
MMLNTEERELIINHAIEKVDNLEIALSLELCLQEIKNKVVHKFLDDIYNKLKSLLKEEDWIIQCKYEKTKLKLAVSKDYWTERIQIGIGDEGNLKNFFIGIYCEKNLVTKDVGELLRTSLREEVGYEKSFSDDWIWWQYLPDKNWSSIETLIKLHHENSRDALDNYSNQIRIVSETVAATIANHKLFK